MFSALLQTLQGFLPKRFFIVSFGPVLVIALLNGALLYFEDVRFRDFSRRYFLAQSSSGLDLKNTFFCLLAVLLLAFLYSMLTARLRSLLEGQWSLHMPEWIRREHLRREELDRGYNSYRDQYDDVRSSSEKWKDQLKEARGKEGKTGCNYPAHNPVSREIHALDDKRERGDIITFDELDGSVKGLTKALETNVVDEPDKEWAPDSLRLDGDQQLIDKLVKYAAARLSQASIQKHNQLTVSFSSAQLAPTALGNIARSVSSYAWRRYGMDLDFMWTRLQKVMEGTSYHQTLMEAQIRVDFLVSMFWLLASSLVIWIPYQFFLGTSPLVFALIAVGGPIVLRALYGLCLESYRAFAEVLRGAIDLFRFKLLEELHLPAPSNSVQETRLWEMISRQMRYGEAQGLAYKHGTGQS